MPKASFEALPVSGMFGVVKPSGPTSMKVIDDIKPLVRRSRLFMDGLKIEDKASQGGSGGGHRGKNRRRRKYDKSELKVGQGGTLDPLADGVLVVAIGKATKKLGDFLDCQKEYITTCLLGCETDSYDSEGARVRTAPWRHVTRESVENVLERFRGNIEQTPPIFSALKMDGIPLYEYARKGIPLPRPIEKRSIAVHELELVEWKGSDHTFCWPDKHFSQEQKVALEKMLSGVDKSASVVDEAELAVGNEEAPSAFVLRMRVSGGTYVRSLVHDIAHALGSAGHVVTLTRARQKNFVLQSAQEGDQVCIPWKVFQAAIEDEGERDEDGWYEWEREVMDKIVVIEESRK